MEVRSDYDLMKIRAEGSSPSSTFIPTRLSWESGSHFHRKAQDWIVPTIWGWSWLTHHLTLTRESEIDDEAMRFVKQSYEWAAQP